MSRQRSAPDLFEDETGSGNGFLGLLGQIVSAHPSLAGGSVAFSVIFGFIAANALWHQPGQHPAPILKTREIASPAVPVTQAAPEAAVPGADGVPARTVTTFRIERNDETPTASIPVPDDAPMTAGAPVAAPVPAPAAAVMAERPAADPVLSQIQAILARQGLYGGEIDGLIGPKSRAAISAWEKTNGYSQTGEPTPALLQAMGAAPRSPASIPAKTPADAPSATAARQAVSPATSPAMPNATPNAAPPVNLAGLEDIPAPKPRPAPGVAMAVDTRTGEPVTVPAEIPNGPNDMVRRIQSGLSNIAYADITVDGVAGAETRAAIGAFERHYRLPVTGEPNETVLNKLIEIGAL